MNEPASSGTAAGAAGLAGLAGWKAIGGAAGVAAGGVGLALIVVMLMTPPRSRAEWAVGLITTVLGSISGGAAVIVYLDLFSWMTSVPGLLAVLGLVFLCGLPAWAVVRMLFTFLERRKDKDLAEVAVELRQAITGRGQP